MKKKNKLKQLNQADAGEINPNLVALIEIYTESSNSLKTQGYAIKVEQMLTQRGLLKRQQE